MNTSDPTGRSANSRATSAARSERLSWVRRVETAPIAAPIAASRTTGATRSRSATGWLSATRTSSAAKTARMGMMSCKGLLTSRLGAGLNGQRCGRQCRGDALGLSTGAGGCGARLQAPP